MQEVDGLALGVLGRQRAVPRRQLVGCAVLQRHQQALVLVGQVKPPGVQQALHGPGGERARAWRLEVVRG